LFTQCSKCETVFRLSAQVLRAAGGQVRCGHCGEVFNALARLAEDPTAFAGGESPLELEARADSILQAPAAHDPAAAATPDEFDDSVPPGVEIAKLEVMSWREIDSAAPEEADDAVPEEEDDEASLEFTLPPGELDRIFIGSKSRAPQALPPEPAEGSVEDPAATAAAEPATESAAAAGETRLRVTGIDVPEEVRRDVLAGFEQAVLPETEPPIPRRRPFSPWFGAAIVLALLLAAQVVHQNREWLAVHEPLGASVRTLYSMLGLALPAPANLASYQLRQWGVTGDPSATGTLRVRASILNTANQLQPYPLLRVTLANRFGNRVGARDFEPAEYLGKPPARMLAPGERVDATLDILDPGKSAEGFEIDVCLRSAVGRVSCANDAAVQAKQ
jgi:predicted Zn finger-like uncharacterized protein